MMAGIWRAPLLCIALVAGFIAPLLIAPSDADAQGLQVVIIEDPFVCDAIVRPLGTVSGFNPGEAVEFSAPELNGVFSRRSADAAGQVAMRWNCDRPRTWNVTIRGTTSGRTASFVLTGKVAPPPPDAPLGAAFDNKTAMTTGEMAIWKDFSPFNTAGIYIPVNSSWDNRADKIQSNLTSSWVQTVFADGWKLIPIYVGFQAPDRCATARFEGLSPDPDTARRQGAAAADDAVASVISLGIPAGNPIYYDMEAYRPGCSSAVLAFLDAWTEGVQAQGYLSGVYGSRSSTMFDLSRALNTPGFNAPDAVWVSTGNGRTTAYGLEMPPDSQWAGARMHQYRLSVTRTYGGVTVEIDENIVDAPVATATGGQVSSAPPAPAPQPAAPAPAPSGVDSDGDGVLEPEPDNCDEVANPDQADLDGDGDGDVCDVDIDGDGVDNVLDYGPTDVTIGAERPVTPTATPEPDADLVDSDGDGIGEPEPDNCDAVANPDQADLDNDGDGDVCDSDIDGDGVANNIDQEPRDPFIGAAPTPTAEPTSAPEPTVPAATVEPEPTSPPDPTAVPTAEPEPDTVDLDNEPGQVIVLPTPLPTASATAVPATPLPTVEQAEVVPAQSTEPPSDPDPDTTIEQASDTVTITVQEGGSLMPYLLSLVGIFGLFCLGMGTRQFFANRSAAKTAAIINS